MPDVPADGVLLPAAPLPELPLELGTRIAALLEARGLTALGGACTRLRASTRGPSLWHTLYRRRWPEHGLVQLWSRACLLERHHEMYRQRVLLERGEWQGRGADKAELVLQRGESPCFSRPAPAVRRRAWLRT